MENGAIFVPLMIIEVSKSLWTEIANLDKNSEYDQEIPQSQTADNPVAPSKNYFLAILAHHHMLLLLLMMMTTTVMTNFSS